MIKEPSIKVGLITSGKPVIRKEHDEFIISNVLIGEGFHWEKTIPIKVKGNIVMLDSPQENIHCINTLPIESYLESVAGSEMNPSAPEEFLKAHAVISRSWALRKLQPRHQNRPTDPTVTWEESDDHIGFDVCSDDHCQRYQGIQDNEERMISAVKQTRGEVLTVAPGDIADARFSKCCGGRTEIFSTCWADSDLPYLKSFEDPWCDLGNMDRETRTRFLDSILKNYDRTTIDFYLWEENIDKDLLSTKIKDRYGIDLGSISSLEKKDEGASGRIKLLKIKGDKGSVTVGKELTIRRLLSDSCLYSSWFDIKETSCGFKLKGRGWGHGVGLCQIGAARMAFEGKDYREILQFYYPGTKIEKLYD